MRNFLFAAAAMLVLGGGAAQASTVLDATGDFVPGFAGPHDPDLDVVKFSATFDGSANFLFSATLAGDINTAAGGLYVIGADTGAGAIHPFAGLGAPNVTFDQVILVHQNGAASVGAHALTPTISGNTFSVMVPLAFLPSTGFAARDYTFNLWPRNASNQISDFAPDNSMLSAVPEPATWATMISGLAMLGVVARRRRRTLAGLTAA